MKKLALLLVGLTVSTGCLAKGASPIHLLCTVNNVFGESQPSMDILGRESEGVVTVNSNQSFPATFSSATISWEVNHTIGTEALTYPSRIDRYTGELTVMSPRAPGRVILSGSCSAASEKERKF